MIFVGAGGTSLERTSVSTLSPKVRLASGTGLSLQTESSNGSTLLAFSGAPAQTLSMASATTAGTLSALVPEANLAAAGFTRDSSQALTMTFVSASDMTGTLTGWPVAGGASRAIDPAVLSWGPAKNARVVFTDNSMTTTADLKVVDLATAAEPTLIVSQAHTGWALSPAGDKLVFSWSQVIGPSAGIYVVAVP